jgi:transcriptional regulator with XRE-family HTH domain
LKEKLRELREKKGLSQKKLADKLGVGRTTVTLWELGINKPRTDMLPSLAKVLGCKVDALLCSKT